MKWPEGLPKLREAVNVDDLKERDKLIRRMAKIRARVEASLAEIRAWNAAHPNEEPLDAAFEESMLAWYDGKGPMPDMLVKSLPAHLRPGFHDVL